MPGDDRTIAMTSLLLACVYAGLMGPASGQTAQNISSYTSAADKDCRKLNGGSADDDGGTRVCPGPAGLVVVVSEGDLRETVSIGRNAKGASSEPAAKAWFGPFSSTTPTIEWRRAAKDKPPFAMIQRWHLADIEDEGKDGRPIAKQLLVVTRLQPGSTNSENAVCHVAYIDVKANANPNDLAREAADTIARDFKCGTDRVKVVGTSGRAVELAQPR
ncbi:hypothetical protein YH63_014280 [Afipia massiliensis]|uniref:Uncharacterized protein n=1 Tax=Afipia massiliensis TaxID=211460 RepID=A0A4U6BSC8_9BRAD|nr:hypothetical protein [Afipia massiliensis]TKT72505.1 hypothetical protein YH63_014280 [Afipia massiliensis]